MFNPTPEQQAIFDYVKAHAFDNGQKALAIRARAGTGKTATIVQLTKLMPSMSGIYCAFNKDIVTDVEPKLRGSGIYPKTFHSMGYSALAKAIGVKSLNPNGAKYKALAETWGNRSAVQALLIGDSEKAKAEMKKALCDLMQKTLDFVRFRLVGWDDMPALLDLVQSLDDEGFSADVYQSIAGSVASLMTEAETSLREQKSLDFTDMIYWVVRWDLAIPQYGWVLVDECQDLSPMQREMVARSLRNNGFIIAVGDDRQAIYAFSGADSDSFDLTVSKFGAHVLPLTLTRRCGKHIVQHAQTLVSDFRAFDTNPDGRVVYLDEAFLTGALQEGDMVLSRVKAPIVGACLDLLSQGKPARILGSDIGKSLIKVAEKVATRKGFTFETFKQNLDAYCAEQIQRYEKKGDDRGASNVADECEALNVIIERVKPMSIAHLSTEIDKLFSGTGGVTLATAHKSKGLEAERVFLIAPARFPLTHPKMTPEQFGQESNLYYVAMTRAKDTLVYVTNKKYVKDHPPAPYVVMGLDGIASAIETSEASEASEPIPAIEPETVVNDPISNAEPAKAGNVLADNAPRLQATGNLKADMAQATAIETSAVEALVKRLTLREATALRDILTAYIAELEVKQP